MATEAEIQAIEDEANRRLDIDPTDEEALAALEQVRMQRDTLALLRGEPEPE